MAHLDLFFFSKIVHQRTRKKFVVFISGMSTQVASPIAPPKKLTKCGVACCFGVFFQNYPSSHNHGSQKRVPPIRVTSQIWPFSTSMVMGERVTSKEITRKAMTLHSFN